jgi:hypothetical protein
VSTYREIVGKKIKKVSSDPSSGLDGEIWYNSTRGTLRGVSILSAWSSTTSLPVVNQNGVGLGTVTAGLNAGGYGPSSPPFSSQNITLEFNGVGWTPSGNMNTARHALGGFGIQTAAVVFGGKVDPGGSMPANVEEYNGSTWSEETNQPVALQEVTGAGILTAGLSIGGKTGPGFPTRVTSTYEYDGTNWTAGGALPAAKTFAGSAGTQTAGLAFGGNIAPDNAGNTTEEYNGTSWTAVPGTMNTSRFEMGKCGTQTAALSFGGNTTPAYTAFSDKTEEYDGTTWTEKTSMPAATNVPLGFGSTTNAISAGGTAPAITSNCLEYNLSTNKITAAAWAAGGSISTARQSGSAFGTQTAAAVVGGETSGGPNTTATEEYDGASWTAGGAYPAGFINISTAGTQTAAFSVGGTPPTTNISATYNGASWTTGTVYPISVYECCSTGTVPAGLVTGGNIPGTVFNTTNEYASGSWTSGGNLNTSRASFLGAGTQTASTITTGNIWPSPGATAEVDVTEEYNGTGWTTGNAMLESSNGNGGAAGTGSDFIIFGMGGLSTNGTVYGYDGTNWSTRPSLGTARTSVGGCGTATAALCTSGRAPGYSTAVEEFTGETSALNIENFTTS